MRIFRRLFERRDFSRQIEKELQFHIDEQADRYVAAGWSRTEALRRTRAEFGGVQQIKEQVRDVWLSRWLDEVRRDTQFAFRTYVRAPIFVATAILTLALGIGVNTALFTIVRQVLLTTLPVSHPQQLVEIDCNARPGSTGGGAACMHSYPAFRLLSTRHEGLSGLAAFSPVPNGLIAAYRGRRELITGQLASANIFNLLGVTPGEGRLLQDLDDAPGAEAVAVLSHGYWQRAFGASKEIIGQALALNNRMVTIVGVLPVTFRGVTFGESYDVILPLGTANAFRAGPMSPSGVRSNILSTPFMGWLTFLGRRVPGVADEDIAKRLEPTFRQSMEEMLAPVPLDLRKQMNLRVGEIRVNVRPAAFGASSNLRQGLAPTLRVLMVVVVLIFLITCANLAGLFLARAINRQREFGLRMALGAARSRLLRQVLTESLLLAFMGGGLGLLLAQWIGPAGFSLATDETVLRAVDLAPDAWTLGFTALVSCLAGLVVGLATRVQSSTSNPQDAFRSRSGRTSTRSTKTLLTVQIALTITLVGSAALLLQTLTNFRSIDLGFRQQKLMTIRMDAGLGTFERSRAIQYVRQAADALASLPGVTSVTYANVAMGTGVPINLVLKTPGSSGSSGVISAGPGFVRTLGLTLLAGRDFDAGDREGSADVAIVNESFATHFFQTTDAIGRTFALQGPGNPSIAIVGVVKDARDSGVKRPTQPVMYVPFGHREVNTATFSVRAETIGSSLTQAVRGTLERLEPSVGIARMRTVDAQLDDVLRRERLLAALGTVFGGLALLLLAIGLFGMLNGMVVRRTTEIGVRMALGASRRAIVWMLARETLVLLAVGIGLGVAGYLAAGRVIQSELFGVRPSDPLLVSAVVAALLLVAAAAVSLPARRATHLDPVSALRAE